jgi:hypothetical protein
VAAEAYCCCLRIPVAASALPAGAGDLG